MNLIPIGFLSLTLFALADGFILPQAGGFGGLSVIFSILLIILFVAALAQQNNNNNTNQCAANYIPTPNDVTSCIRFFSTPMKSFTDARAACVGDGGDLLKLSTATFPSILELAQNNGGTCEYWVGAEEPGVDGVWKAFNGDPIPTTSGLFFNNHLNGNANSGGLMSAPDNYFLVGEPKANMHCYICQKDI